MLDHSIMIDDMTPAAMRILRDRLDRILAVVDGPNSLAWSNGEATTIKGDRGILYMARAADGGGVSNEVYCDECFRAKWPGGHEEKTCVHGVWVATCSGCGKTRKLDEKPYWHCFGTATTHGSGPA